MRLLLDTHALLWALAEDERFGPGMRTRLEDLENEVLVSVVSLWEIAIKIRLRKLQAHLEEIVTACTQQEFTLLGIDPAHLRELAKLPPHHRDPFDHLLMAQAIVEGASFVSDDRYASTYPVTLLRCGA